MAASESEQPVLSTLLNHIYYESFGYHDHEDNKEERSANDALLLLSEHYRCTNNPYFIAKIKEIWKSIQIYELKWTADVWNMALAKFAYDDEELNEEDATKVLNNFMTLWLKKNPGATIDVNITKIIALKKGLIGSGAHINHVSAFNFILKGYSLLPKFQVYATNAVLAVVAEKVVSVLPHHISPSPAEDELFEANNYFILRHLKSVQVEMIRSFGILDDKLNLLERSDRSVNYIMRRVTSHHDYETIRSELSMDSDNWKHMRRIQMNIVGMFTQICRNRFFDRYPTAILLTDIDEQVAKYGVDVSDLLLLLEPKYDSSETATSSEDNDLDDYQEGETDEGLEFKGSGGEGAGSGERGDKIVGLDGAGMGESSSAI